MQIEILQTSKDQNLRFEAAWALTNIASGTTAQARYVVENDGLVAFKEGVLHGESVNVVEQCIWGLGNITGDSIELRDLSLKEVGRLDEHKVLV